SKRAALNRDSASFSFGEVPISRKDRPMPFSSADDVSLHGYSTWKTARLRPPSSYSLVGAPQDAWQGSLSKNHCAPQATLINEAQHCDKNKHQICPARR